MPEPKIETVGDLIAALSKVDSSLPITVQTGGGQSSNSYWPCNKAVIAVYNFETRIELQV